MRIPPCWRLVPWELYSSDGRVAGEDKEAALSKTPPPNPLPCKVRGRRKDAVWLAPPLRCGEGVGGRGFRQSTKKPFLLPPPATRHPSPVTRRRGWLDGGLDLAAQELAAHAGQPEIMVAGQPLQVQEATGAHRRLVGAFEDRRALVHLVEHGRVEHRRPGLFRLHQLLPEEPPLQSGDLIQRGLRAQVVPTEAR